MPPLDTSSLPEASVLANKVASADYAAAQTQFARAARAIVGAANEGRNSVAIQGQLDEPVLKALRAKGYKVSYVSDPRDGDYTTITFV